MREEQHEVSTQKMQLLARPLPQGAYCLSFPFPLSFLIISVRQGLDD
jgi:hypothetical protein